MASFGTRPCWVCREDRLFISDADGFPICWRCRQPLGSRPRRSPHAMHTNPPATPVSLQEKTPGVK